MRKQFLANEYGEDRELDADIVSLLHIAPAHNLDFRTVTSPDLKPLGETATGVWKQLVKTDRFHSVSTEELFGRLLKVPPAEMENWAVYLSRRYRWVITHSNHDERDFILRWNPRVLERCPFQLMLARFL